MQLLLTFRERSEPCLRFNPRQYCRHLWPGTDSQGRPFIIMGYVDGESLADILAREGKLSEERALDIFTQICEALSHSHMKGIIHRDIKPSNIIISKTESGGDMVHIVDFGIARCIYDEVTKTQALTKL
jgi:serine/threonine protein kinase